MEVTTKKRITNRVTVKQKKIAQLIIENATLDKPLNGGEMLAKAGYSSNLYKQPSRVLEADGVRQALDDYGFNEDAAKKVVASILSDEDVEPRDRLKASEIIFKVHGSYAPEKSVNVNVDITDGENIKALTEKLNETYKNQ